MANNIRYSAMIAYLKQCSALNGILGFQTGKDNQTRIMTLGNDSGQNRVYIDGSRQKNFDFVIEFYKPLNAVPYNAAKTTSNQNLGTLLDVQALIDWLDEQTDAGNMPNFGSNCIVDSVKSLSNEPLLAWIDTTNYATPIAKYTVTVRVEYVDYSRANQ